MEGERKEAKPTYARSKTPETPETPPSVIGEDQAQADGELDMTANFSLSGVTVKVRSESGAPKTILEEISTEIPAGEIFTIVGPSGSGKSTLLSLLNMLREPTKGEVRFNGRPIRELDVLRLRRRVGMAFQRPALFPGSVRYNVEYGPRLWKNREEGQAERMLDLVGLGAEYLERDTGTLSGGEQQRVALARTLANDPDVLLLDEVTASLDPTAARRSEDLIRDLKDRFGLTVVWITHDLAQAKRVGDRTLLLVDGKVSEQGPTQDFFENPRTEEGRRFIAGMLDKIVEEEIR